MKLPLSVTSIKGQCLVPAKVMSALGSAAALPEMLAVGAAADGEPEPEQTAPAPTPTAAADDDAPPAAGAPLPLGDDEFPDDIIALICRFLGLRELGRLACVSRRFTEATLTEPGGAQLLSPIEEGARLRLEAAVASCGGGSAGGGAGGGAAAVRLADETWMRALWRVQYRLVFTSCGPKVVLSEEGALRLRAAERGQRLRHGACVCVCGWGTLSV
jgi:hypothetical protein